MKSSPIPSRDSSPTSNDHFLGVRFGSAVCVLCSVVSFCILAIFPITQSDKQHSTMLEINVRNLIAHCEELARDEPTSWRLKKYIKSLDTMIDELQSSDP